MSSSVTSMIKPEYIVKDHVSELSLECVSEKDKKKLLDEEAVDGPPQKKQRLSKAEKKKLRGQNKSRPNTFKVNREVELCNSLINATCDTKTECSRANCKFMHNVQEYLKTKPADIGKECYNYRTSGSCTRGLACRFGSDHISPDGFNIVDEEKQKAFQASGSNTVGYLSYDLQNLLRKRQYDFTVAEALVKYNDRQRAGKQDADRPVTAESVTSGCITDEDIIKLLQREKRKIDWTDKLFLSPLTTVGNLPFRRICKEFGADVTCGEMAMCSSLLQGAPQEWALMKRHHTEDLFGVQLCANNPYLITKCGHLLEKEINVDFIDVNLGCPIELVYREGAGSGLLRRPRILESCIRNLCDVVTVPVTVKTRTGVYTNENIAHTLVKKFGEWGASLVTIHGRSREQRYTKQADWTYIKKCVEEASPLPILGNGDILSYDDYNVALETCPNLTGVMIGRGGLIKPWLFTEIKEQKLWDISSSERFDIIKKYANYGLEHWGSDTKGVENTRRFMLEWLSFLHRYVPVGLMERPPQKVNEQPPRFIGRNDLETLMASAAATDWIKISEMVLGPVPEGFQFLPKHKANSYT